MKLEFNLKESHFFDAEYFITSRSINFKKRKFFSVFFVFIGFSIFAIVNYFLEKDLIKTGFTVLIFLIFLFIYYKYLGYSIENNIRKFAYKNHGDEIGKKVFLEIKDSFLTTGSVEDDGDYQIKVKIDKIKNIFDEKKYLFFQITNNLYIFLPKEDIKEEELKKFKDLLDK